jgi:hypothetical protein
MPVAGDQVTRFVLLFQGRCGSSNLIEALDSHPDIRAQGEVLAAWRSDAASQLREARYLLGAPAADSAAARLKTKVKDLAARCGLGPRPAKPVVGFKIKLRDLADPGQFAALMRELGAKVILLRRRNRVKIVVSSINSRRLHSATGEWNARSEGQRPGPVAIDPKEFESQLRIKEEHEQLLLDYVRTIGLPTLELCYEDLLSDYEGSLGKLFAFLGVPYQLVRGKCVKNTSDDLRDALLNFEELRARYAGTPYEAMFDEVLVPARPGG